MLSCGFLLATFIAVVCLLPAGNSEMDSLWNNIRSPQNQADYYSYIGRPQPMVDAAPAAAPLLSPGLVSAVGSARPLPNPLTVDVDQRTSDEIARKVLDFAQNLNRQLNSNYRKTTIFSPLSITSALALLLLGAKGRSYVELSTLFGQTDMVKFHEQFGLLLADVQQPTRKTISPQRQPDNWHNDIRNSLRSYPRNRQTQHIVHIANGLFVQQGYNLNPSYRQAITSIYKSELQTFDFERQPETARFEINSWVEKQTRGKIENILADSLPESTRIILANALYFKGQWEADFLMAATKPDNFYPNGLGTEPVVLVDMMATVGSFPYFEDYKLQCRIVGLPYHGNLTTMYLIQPLQSSVEQLQYLQQSLTADAIEQMIAKMTRTSAIVAMPKMHLNEAFKLTNELQTMGLVGIFNPVQSDLSLIGIKGATSAAALPVDGLSSLQRLSAERQAAMASQVPTPPSDLIVSDILHKVDFVVNEQGTEAAAATVAVLKKSGPEVLFRAETPFIVLVRHDLTKLPLFYGMINEPPSATKAN